MSTKRKPMRARRSAPQPLPEPTENQIEEAMIAFERSKVRHKLLQVAGEFIVRITHEQFTITPAMPPAGLTITVKSFLDEASARQWREREIIREAITAGMRAKP